MRRTVVLLIFLGIVFTESGAAQLPIFATAPRPQEIPFRVSCGACSLELVKVFTFDSAAHVPLLSPAVAPARDSKGRFYVAAFGPAQVAVFSSDGKFLTAFPGTSGGTERIVGNISHIMIDATDSIYVRNGGEVFVYSPQFVFARRMSIVGTSLQLYRKADGNLLGHASTRTSERLDDPLHEFTAAGVHVRSFGYEPPRPGSSMRIDLGWMEAAFAANGRSVWIAHANAYRLRQWSADGQLLNNLDIHGAATIDANPPERRMPAGRVGTPPPPIPSASLALVGVDSAGLVYIQVSAPSPAGAAARERRIDVFDPISKTFLLSQKFDNGLQFIAGSHFAVTFNEAAEGPYRLTVWRVGVLRR